MFDKILARIADSLESAGMPYMIIGGQVLLALQAFDDAADVKNFLATFRQVLNGKTSDPSCQLSLTNS